MFTIFQCMSTQSPDTRTTSNQNPLTERKGVQDSLSLQTSLPLALTPALKAKLAEELNLEAPLFLPAQAYHLDKTLAQRLENSAKRTFIPHYALENHGGLKARR